MREAQASETLIAIFALIHARVNNCIVDLLANLLLNLTVRKVDLERLFFALHRRIEKNGLWQIQILNLLILNSNRRLDLATV